MEEVQKPELLKLEHLGLVSSIAKDIGFVEKIDSLLGEKKSYNANVSFGESVLAMVFQGLGYSNNRLYLTTDFFKAYAVEKLFSSDKKAEHFGATVQTRTLDKIYDYGPSRFVQDFCIGVATKEKLLKKFFHLDTSSFKMMGKYGVDGNITITHGFSKDHRFDLKQLVLLLVSNEDGIPMYSESHSGNATDSQIYSEIIKKLEADLQCIGESRFFVLDSSVYNKEFLKNGNICSYWLTRVPESIKFCKEAVEHDFDDSQWTKIDNDYKYIELASNYGGVKQRCIVVRNRESKYKELKTFKNNLEKQQASLEKVRDKMEGTCYKTSDLLDLEIKSLRKRYPFFTIEYNSKPVKEKLKGHKKKVKVGVSPSIWINRNEEKIAKKERTKGRFVLATNCLESDDLTTEEMLQAYRDRNKAVESGFKFLKDRNHRLNQLHFQKESRIEAMMAVATIILFMNNLCQLRLREALKNSGETIPNQKGKPTQKPTFNWAAFLMRNVTLIRIKSGNKISEFIQSVNKDWETIVRSFGSNALEIYGFT